MVRLLLLVLIFQFHLIAQGYNCTFDPTWPGTHEGGLTTYVGSPQHGTVYHQTGPGLYPPGDPFNCGFGGPMHVYASGDPVTGWSCDSDYLQATPWRLQVRTNADAPMQIGATREVFCGINPGRAHVPCATNIVTTLFIDSSYTPSDLLEAVTNTFRQSWWLTSSAISYATTLRTGLTPGEYPVNNAFASERVGVVVPNIPALVGTTLWMQARHLFDAGGATRMFTTPMTVFAIQP